MNLLLIFIVFFISITNGTFYQIKNKTNLWTVQCSTARDRIEEISGIGYDVLKQAPQIYHKAMQKLVMKSSTCPGLYESGVSSYSRMLPDPYFLFQWNLQDCREDNSLPIIDMNVVPVWYKYKIFGKGIIAGIFDTSIEETHEDLIDNFDKSLTKYATGDSDGDSVYHGTVIAGLIAMRAGNNICGAGIAPLITFGSIKKTDYLGGLSLLEGFTFARDKVDILVCSWGARDDGKRLIHIGYYVMSGLKEGIIKGRQGKGIVYLFSGGNGGKMQDNCAYDPFVNSMYTIVAGNINNHGKSPPDAEACSAILVSSYGGDIREANFIRITSTSTSNGCSKCSVAGASLLPPQIGGIVALILEANPNLTWRGVQHVLVWTCEVAAIADNHKWRRNKVGLFYHHHFGFGMVNALAAVELAFYLKMYTFPPMNSCASRLKFKKPLLFSQDNALRFFVRSNGCENLPTAINYMEHVQIFIIVNYEKRGNLQIMLTSPSGTKSQILDRRPTDDSPDGFYKWIFDATHFWGENPKGAWIIEIYDLEDVGTVPLKGEVKMFVFIIHGTEDIPPHYSKRRKYYKFEKRGTFWEPQQLQTKIPLKNHQTAMKNRRTL